MEYRDNYEKEMRDKHADFDKFTTWSQAYRGYLPGTPNIENKKMRDILQETIADIHEILGRAQEKAEAL
jgi:hypothetical protein